jgi:hypothetical protein
MNNTKADSIENLLIDKVRDGSLSKYDLKFEIQRLARTNNKSKYIEDESSNTRINNFILYKYIYPNKSDCDHLEFSVYTQKTLIEEKIDKGLNIQKDETNSYSLTCSGVQGLKLVGDTMTSVSKNAIDTLIFEQRLKNQCINENGAKFLSLYTTIGNQILVSSNGKQTSFNTKRSHCDFSDVLLFAIRNWYYERINSNGVIECSGNGCHVDENKIENCTISKLVNDETRKVAEKWLHLFKSWDDFIDANALRGSFVDEKGVPIKCWKNHAKVTDKVTDDNLVDFLTQENSMIEKRSINIMNLLKSKYEK